MHHNATSEKPIPDHESLLPKVDVREALDSIATFARENPHAALVGAIAAGFVVGGGLSPRLLRLATGLLARSYGAQLLEESIGVALGEKRCHPERIEGSRSANVER